MTPDPAFVALETPRLRIRRFRPGDAAGLLAYRTDPEVARYQGWDPARFDLAAAEAFVREVAVAVPGTPGEWFQFALELRATGELVGDVGIGADVHDVDMAELGFTLAREHHGHGYATEAVQAVTAYVEKTLGAGRVVAIADERNLRSIAVLERAGFTPLQTEVANVKGETVRERWYEHRSAG